MTHPSSNTLPPMPATQRIGCIPLHVYFPYWASLMQGINARAAQLGLELCLPTSDPDEACEAAINEVLRQRPNVALLPDNLVDEVPSVAHIFAAAGIPTVGMATPPGAQYAGVVRADEAQGAAAVVAYLFERMGGVGKVAHIAAPRETHRRTEFHKLLKQHPQIELAYEGEGRWTREAGAQVMRAALTEHTDLRGVFANNDLMAVGAADVIAELGLGAQITVVGFDADPEGLIAIHEGRMAATVYRGQYGLGRAAVDMAFDVIQGRHVAPAVCTPTRLITAANLVDATLDTTYMLPELLRGLVASTRAQRQLQQATIAAQRLIIQELSTPIIPISDAILIMPLIGTIDSDRAQNIMEAMLQAISQHRARYLIIDITGIAAVDTIIMDYLMRAGRAVQLLGAHVIMVGVSPAIAQTLVSLDINLQGVTTYATLQAGFAYAQQRLTVPAHNGNLRPTRPLRS